MKRRILVFGGTTEGRTLAETLAAQGYEVTVSVATAYGASLLKEGGGTKILTGRLDQREMEDFLKKEAFDRVVDATHPYAVLASENIAAACKETCTPMTRILREAGDLEGLQTVEDAAAAAHLLSKTTGNILLTTGTKELSAFVKLERERLYLRLLPSIPSLTAAEDAGILPSHILCMQGPFSVEFNRALLAQWQISYLVTKCAGKQGGFSEKWEAARQVGVRLVAIGRPKEETGMTLGAFLDQVKNGGI